jgi:hypothetical protein
MQLQEDRRQQSDNFLEVVITYQAAVAAVENIMPHREGLAAVAAHQMEVLELQELPTQAAVAVLEASAALALKMSAALAVLELL